VDRASTTTVSALRTAVVVAQALGNQQRVLQQVGTLNQTTGNLIASTSSMLKTQAAAVHAQASSATVDLQTLRQAFSNVYETMDSVAGFKAQALAGMQQTVDALAQEIERARPYLERARAREGEAAQTDPTSVAVWTVGPALRSPARLIRPADPGRGSVTPASRIGPGRRLRGEPSRCAADMPGIPPGPAARIMSSASGRRPRGVGGR